MLPNRYDFTEAEPRLAALWHEQSTYAFDPDGPGAAYRIDTPPPTVSGQLHLGHCYSYTQADVFARYRRMRGDRVFYPMGFDDNGLPTERYVEKVLGRTARQMGRTAFIEACLRLTAETEDTFERLWRRLGLSIDWRYRYSTIAPAARRVSQWAFIQLHRAGRVYAQEAPTLWCPECRTAIAQAELDEVTIASQFSTLAFMLPDGAVLPIATTRAELLPACVAVFVHPADARYSALHGASATTPLWGASVPILTDEGVDPAKGTGAVMCCTFGDGADVRWWRTHALPLRAVIDADGRMTAAAGAYAGLTTTAARARILGDLAAAGTLLGQTALDHLVATHERCGTPVEYRHARQWFIRVLDRKARLIEAGRRIRWHPAYMRQRYESWVEQLQWDWCVSRQRMYGVPFPAWTCRACGATALAELEQLPVDPAITAPAHPCACGAADFAPEPDVMDTWATSSCTPLLLAGWPDAPDSATRLPASVRPQAHDIIRTWAFYSIAQTLEHTGDIPWRDLLISGHGLSAQRTKISKSKDHTERGPLAVIEAESADALRYWATAGRTGADSPYVPETVNTGRRLVTKLWNAGRFAAGRLADYTVPAAAPALALTDEWLLARLDDAITRATAALEGYEFAAARDEVERFFWSDLCDNYFELAKARLYGDDPAPRLAAQWTLDHALLAVLKLFAPYLPYVTEALYLSLFRDREGHASVHTAPWPVPLARAAAPRPALGAALLAILNQTRKAKAERSFSVGAELPALAIHAPRGTLALLRAVETDLRGATRARAIRFVAGTAAHGVLVTVTFAAGERQHTDEG
jgi:valyl-tRNA synthetase